MLRIVYIKSVLITLSVVTGFNASAQKQDGLDSILYHLNQLSGIKEKDSLVLKAMVIEMSSFKPEYLADKRFEQAMIMLKSTLKPDHYYRIAYDFLFTANYKSKAGEYDYPIDYGLNMIDELKSYSSIHQKFILLTAMRDIRVPFRNGSRRRSIAGTLPEFRGRKSGECTG